MPKNGNNDLNSDLVESILCGAMGMVFAPFMIFSRDPHVIAAGICASLCFICPAAIMLINFLRYRATCKKAEFADIASKCRYHPDKDIEDAVAEAVSGAKYWTFKMVWKKLRDSHDFGRVFTAIYR